MQIQQYSYPVLIPHNTPLCNLEHEHSNILAAARIASPDSIILPFYPQVCIINSPLSIQELKATLTGCVIQAPVFSNGLYIRPVTCTSNGPEIISAGIFPACLFPAHCRQQENSNYLGIPFGWLQNATESQNTSCMADFTKIPPLHLRVFRLHMMHITAPACPQTDGISFQWTFSPAQWVKLSS